MIFKELSLAFSLEQWSVIQVVFATTNPGIATFGTFLILNEKEPACQETLETWVQSLGQEDTLEEEMATHSTILAWRIPGTEEPGGLQSLGSRRVTHGWSNLAHMRWLKHSSHLCIWAQFLYGLLMSWGWLPIPGRPRTHWVMCAGFQQAFLVWSCGLLMSHRGCES